jgi:hypothetical protein
MGDQIAIASEKVMSIYTLSEKFNQDYLLLRLSNTRKSIFGHFAISTALFEHDIRVKSLEFGNGGLLEASIFPVEEYHSLIESSASLCRDEIDKILMEAIDLDRKQIAAKSQLN